MCAGCGDARRPPFPSSQIRHEWQPAQRHADWTGKGSLSCFRSVQMAPSSLGSSRAVRWECTCNYAMFCTFFCVSIETVHWRILSAN